MWANQLRSTTWGIYYHARSFQGLITDKQLEVFKSRLASLPRSAQEDERRRVYYAEQLAKLEILVERLPASLTPKTSAEIRGAVGLLGGPLVFFNINRYSCDALALVPDFEDAIHIPLPNIDYHKLKSMQGTFLRFLNGREEESDRNLDRVGKLVRPPAQARRQEVSLPDVLGFLWTNVVELVLDNLAIHVTEDLPRVWWCPSGPLSFLPLHAAGLYENDSKDNISNYVVSSYISDASSIFRAVNGEFTQPTDEFRILAVAHPAGCGLPGTMEELEIIRRHTHPHPLITLTGNEATPLAVRHRMKESNWVHFACHGIQHPQEPSQSALILANKTRLNILDIGTLCLRLPNPEFAFLSACQTAKSHLNTPDEFIHLAGGMMAAGYRSIIATMWSISDSSAPFIADLVYQKLFEEERPDYRQAAYALHDAVKKLRTEMGGTYMDWVPFLHMGL
ncbi:hypothetical protein BDN72DRAFT_769366 [Pluteus cervinus]|uniref:Uncharacterized protein n=1 Tax=Pluteus cervinus TaxID=181527 RepID=A0ACD3AR47_9AGAR|nr:hypothetical protein BDN72DRAFT_769366 [Pluteus cervinus]